MAPIDALSLTGANRMQVFTHGVVPSVLPALLGIGLYRLDENIRASLVLGFVGAGGIGFQLLTAMNLFQYREVSLLLIVIFVIVFAAERLSAVCRETADLSDGRAASVDATPGCPCSRYRLPRALCPSLPTSLISTANLPRAFGWLGTTRWDHPRSGLPIY